MVLKGDRTKKICLRSFSLIGVAIGFLEAAGVDWGEVRNYPMVLITLLISTEASFSTN